MTEQEKTDRLLSDTMGAIVLPVKIHKIVPGNYNYADIEDATGRKVITIWGQTPAHTEEELTGLRRNVEYVVYAINAYGGVK